MFTKESIIEEIKQSVTKSIPQFVGQDLFIVGKFAHKYASIGCYVDRDFQHGIGDFDYDAMWLIQLINYRDTLPQDSTSWNLIKIHFDKNLDSEADFIWDQVYYDDDVQSNKKLKMRK